MAYPQKIETVHLETLNDELSIYDWQRMEVHNLNHTAATIWNLCDGQTSPKQMAEQIKGDLTQEQAEALVWMTLKQLEEANLLATEVVQPAGRQVYTRRQMLVGLGVTMAALPMIYTIVAPTPLHAQSASPPPPVATQTSAPISTPTITPTPITFAITTCNAQNASGGITIGVTDTISTFTIISPTAQGIQLRRRIILNQAGHPQDGQDLDNTTGPTDATGQFTPANFDLSTVVGLTTGVDRIQVQWEFVDPANGTNVCVNLLTLS